MGGDIGDVNLKRTVEEIKRLQEEASSLRQENIQLKVSVPNETHSNLRLVFLLYLHAVGSGLV